MLGLLEDKEISLIVIAGSGTALESAIAFRALRWMLERKYGTDAANRRIYAVTGPEEGGLRQMAKEAGWETFVIPEDVGDGFSVLTAAGLLPAAVAGLDISELMQGAGEARENYREASLENPVWQYAAVRNLLQRSGKAMELIASFEPGFRMLGGWWQQLFAGAEGKDGKGIFPVSIELTADLASLGQLIQQGQRNLFETVIRFDALEQKHTIGGDWKNLDGLNYLEGKTLDLVEEQAYLGAVAAHVDGGVPVITMECGALGEKTVGELLYFLELSCVMSAYILGVNPFDRSGAELYQQNLFRLLGRPEAGK